MAHERFWAKVDRRGPTECWEWRGARQPNGYGHLMVDKRWWMAHRYAYTITLGPIPDGLTIDHLCRNRPCVNPVHLEAITMGENTSRGPSAPGGRTHCPQGHEYSDENTWREANGKRHCRACHRDRQRARRAATRG